MTTAARPDFLSCERTVAGPAFNRWLVPPAAPAIRRCILMAHGFSVVWPLPRFAAATKFPLR